MSVDVIIANAGPLIALAKLNQLYLLAALYAEVSVPQIVYTEVVTQGLAQGEPDALVVRLFWSQRNWPIIEVSETYLDAYRPKALLDPGEIAVLALGLTKPGCLLLLDDAIARGEATRLGLAVKGTLGILVDAFRRQKLDRAQLELLLNEIAARPDIWISASLCHQVLARLFES
jgi:predicted nucleic acid-binding protein